MGASTTLTFTGSSFSIVYETGPLFGPMDIYVDGNLAGTLNEFEAGESFQKLWSYPGQLPFGQHTLQIVFNNTDPSLDRGSLDAVITR